VVIFIHNNIFFGGAIMKKWVCVICGYVYEGSEPPAACPLCNAPASKFVEEKPIGT
jgi:rubrerythrin